MKPDLAEQLLAVVLGWDTETAKNELIDLQTIANYKYDDYRNFEQGIRFIESLANWLSQFELKDREAAYRFMKNRLVYIAANEMAHLVSLAYPNQVFPVLCQQAAERLGISPLAHKRILASHEFQSLQRRSLFLGMSDGAHIDDFRRLNGFLSNEQVHVSYDVTPQRLADMTKDLATWIKDHGGSTSATFSNVFLIDDFSASGNSTLRFDADTNTFKGKVRRFADQLKDPDYHQFFDWERLQVFLVFYLATRQAVDHLTKALQDLLLIDRPPWTACKVLPVHILENSIKIRRETDPDIVDILNRYYDASIETPHTGCVKYGYENCALPLVLSHNTPNNSVYLLWAESTQLKPLFRRITRHKVE